MLSRVVKDSDDAKPVAFRVGVHAPRPRTRKDSLTEAEDLRLQVAELKQAAEQSVIEAREQGRREGETAARQAMAAQMEVEVGKLAETVAAIASLRSETIQRAESDVVRLAVAITRRVLHMESAVNSKLLQQLIEAALEKLQGQEVYRVRVHPDQEKVMKDCLNKFGRGQIVTVVPDPTQPEGGAIFETSRGLLDASMDTQIEEIERRLLDQTEARS
ncbi:MAG TPA: FliH/SctL family protein [Verrucomicrobiae bacterium]|nr:FliH/SctL family protein [Verrucomicrobiae bacterium]